MDLFWVYEMCSGEICLHFVVLYCFHLQSDDSVPNTANLLITSTSPAVELCRRAFRGSRNPYCLVHSYPLLTPYIGVNGQLPPTGLNNWHISSSISLQHPLEWHPDDGISSETSKYVTTTQCSNKKQGHHLKWQHHSCPLGGLGIELGPHQLRDWRLSAWAMAHTVPCSVACQPWHTQWHILWSVNHGTHSAMSCVLFAWFERPNGERSLTARWRVVSTYEKFPPHAHHIISYSSPTTPPFMITDMLRRTTNKSRGRYNVSHSLCGTSLSPYKNFCSE